MTTHKSRGGEPTTVRRRNSPSHGSSRHSTSAKSQQPTNRRRFSVEDLRETLRQLGVDTVEGVTLEELEDTLLLRQQGSRSPKNRSPMARRSKSPSSRHRRPSAERRRRPRSRSRSRRLDQRLLERHNGSHHSRNNNSSHHNRQQQRAELRDADLFETDVIENPWTPKFNFDDDHNNNNAAPNVVSPSANDDDNDLELQDVFQSSSHHRGSNHSRLLLQENNNSLRDDSCLFHASFHNATNHDSIDSLVGMNTNTNNTNNNHQSEIARLMQTSLQHLDASQNQFAPDTSVLFDR